MTTPTLLIALLQLVLAAVGTEADQRDPVRARLVANVDTVAPGDSLYLGIELIMAEGWHTYWRFSGDAGLPTEVAWLLPLGLEAGDLLWPMPGKYEEAGDLVVYGYADSVLLMSKIAVREDLSLPENMVVGAKVAWLVCREICIPGDADLQLQLRTGPSQNAGINANLFDRHLKQVPRPLAESGLAIRANSVWEGGVLQVDIQARADSMGRQVSLVDFYPVEGEDFERIRVVSAVGTTGGATDRRGLKLQLTPFEEDVGSELPGLLLYRDRDSKLRYGTTSILLDAGSSGLAPSAVGQDGVDLLSMDFRSDEEESLSIGLLVAFAILGGFILNLMPCVLPVISIKILSIISQASEDRRTIGKLGLMFSAGIMATFLVLALLVLVLRSGGEQIGWGFQFQYPEFVMAMITVVFVLALSLFGLFTIQLPGTHGSVGGFASGKSAASSFANGVLATILATPCTAPFLGTAVGFAFTQPSGVVVLSFICIGVGMALPYGVLALQPQWLSWLPRPGPWMERFRQSMGFLFAGTAVWLLWVLGNQLGLEGVVWMLAFLVCLSVAAWIVGQLVGLGTSKHRRFAAWGIASAITVAGFLAFLHPVLSAEQELSETPGSASGGYEALDWQPFSLSFVETLLAANQHVFIDFTAEWCWTCKVNERTVLSDHRVRARFEEIGVVLVKADWTNRNSEITSLLNRFGRSGVPLYVLFQAGKFERPIVFPEIITVELVLEKLDEAAG